jgi:putative tricarboxylic transport membrane protein
MDTINLFMSGFGVALTPYNLFLCFIGCFIGTLVGVLPGIGAAATVAILLPVTFSLEPVSALIMLAGIYYGSMYGGSTTSILVNIPGEAASAVTCLDGYQMARQGNAGKALGIAAMGSFIAGTVGVVLLMLVAPPVAEFALRFGPPEIFAVMLFGITILSYLGSSSITKAFLSGGIGFFLGTIGKDITGFSRFTLGISGLYDGVGLVPVLMGLFGISEVIINLERHLTREVFETRIKGLWPNRKDWAASAMPIARGTILGFFLGVIPGPANTISSFASYAIEKRLSKYPDTFGHGAIEGVAGPESANNAASAGNFIPLLTLGIPTSPIMAILMGAMIIHGITPGPLFINSQPLLFWGVIASMYIGNVMLVILNLPLIPIWTKLLKVPYEILFPLIFLFCLIGAFSNNNNLFEVYVLIFFGFLGYLMRKTGFDLAPLILTYILCPLMEEAFRQSLIISLGNPLIFLQRPISAVILIMAVLFIFFSIFSGVKNKRLKIVEMAKDDD